jgi:hypothetical protein
MTARPALAAALALASAPVAAQETSAEALYTVLARQGCTVAERELPDLLGPEGFDFAFVSETLTQLLVEGRASTDARGRLHLPADLCPPAQPVASPRQEVLALFARNDCEMDERRLRAALPDLSDAALRAVLYPLHDSGVLTVRGRSATLAAAACQPTE